MSGKIKYENEHGFTLTELLVAMVIAVVVMAGVLSVYTSQQKSYVTQEQIAAMHQNLRAAMYYMEREIRMAGCDPTGEATPAPGIVTANSDEIQFRMDLSANGAVFGDDEDITYKWDGTELKRNNQIIAENISGLTFQYLDASGATTGTLSAIRFVQISLTAATEDDANSSTLTTRINCRNLWL